jgi:hypothetical protein
MDKELHTLPCFDATKYKVEQTKDYKFVQQIPIDADFALIQPLLNNVSAHSEILMTHSLMRFGYNQNPSIGTSLFIVDKGRIRLYHIDSIDATSRGLKENMESKKQKKIYYDYENKKMLKTASFCEDANYVYTLLTKHGKIRKIRAFVGY